MPLYKAIPLLIVSPFLIITTTFNGYLVGKSISPEGRQQYHRDLRKTYKVLFDYYVYGDEGKAIENS